jgi:hypothetical protein
MWQTATQCLSLFSFLTPQGGHEKKASHQFVGHDDWCRNKSINQGAEEEAFHA